MRSPANSAPVSLANSAPSGKSRILLPVLPLVLLWATSVTLWSESSGARLSPVPRSDLCITEGAIEELPGGRLSVQVPQMRAYVNHMTPQDLEARFTYLGATQKEVRLRSGEVCRQFGLKLRAEDGCNLVYAMWRLEPYSKLVVSLKSNPGQHTSAECTNHGYKNIRAVRSSPLPPLIVGQTHTLHAVMETQQLHVYVDDRLVWDGTLGAQGLRLDGPVGIRSDNARLELQLLVASPTAQHRDEPGCRSNSQESE
jgi:hypothetical protein